MVRHGRGPFTDHELALDVKTDQVLSFSDRLRSKRCYPENAWVMQPLLNALPMAPTPHTTFKFRILTDSQAL